MAEYTERKVPQTPDCSWRSQQAVKDQARYKTEYGQTIEGITKD